MVEDILQRDAQGLQALEKLLYLVKHNFSAVFAVMVQSVLSTLIDAFAIGWIIAKISRPKKRAEVCYLAWVIYYHYFSDTSFLEKCSYKYA